MNEELIRRAYSLWLLQLRTEQIIVSEGKIQSFREMRLQLKISINEMAHRLNMSRQAYWKFEKGAETETTSLASLRRAAEAMDCELQIQLKPKSGLEPLQILWQKILPFAMKHPWLKVEMQSSRAHQKANKLAFVANDLFKSAAVRRKLKLTKRKYS